MHKDSLPTALLSLLSMQAQQQALRAPAAPPRPRLLAYNNAPKPDEPDSDAEYDDTDDIVLPDEFYEGGHSADSPDDKGAYKRDGSGSDDPSRHFECRHCGKKYRWKSTLRRHENVECGGKAPSHQCPYCSYKAKQRGNLGVHIRKHHNDEWYMYATNKVRRNKKTSI